MTTATDTFRVFVSSTFSDMRQERRLLQERVFPRLEEYCRSTCANFQAVDLRWGILEEQQLRHKTMELCLDEITRCQEVSPKPNFVVNPAKYVREAMVAVNFRRDISGAQRLLEEGRARLPGDAKLERALESLHRTFGTRPGSRSQHDATQNSHAPHSQIGLNSITPAPDPPGSHRSIEEDSLARNSGFLGHTEVPPRTKTREGPRRFEKTIRAFAAAARNIKRVGRG